MNNDVISMLSAESEEVLNTATESESEPTDTAGNVLDSLAIMGKGMLGIFLVTAVIILTVVLLNKFTAKKPTPKNDSQDAE